MAETTAISWTRSSINLWSGCTKIGPGCDGCYAEAFHRRIRGKDPETGEAINWGSGRPRIPHIEGALNSLRKWNAKAGLERDAGILWNGRSGYWPVFINSHSDFFDGDVPQAWRDDAFPIFEECSNLSILLVTKRIGNVAKMVPERWVRDGFPPNVRLLITVVNQEEADRDIPKLLALPCKNGISYEPALDGIDWAPWMAANDLHVIDGGPQICWIIVGGESNQPGHKARPFDVAWAQRTVRQCKATGVSAFVKQLGSHVVWNGCAGPDEHFPPGTKKEDTGEGHWRIRLKDRAGADPSEWPIDLRIQEFPL